MSFESVLFLAWKFPKQTLKSLLHSHSHRANPRWKYCRRAVLPRPFRSTGVFIVSFPSLRRGHPLPVSHHRVVAVHTATMRSLRVSDFRWGCTPSRKRKKTELTCISGWWEQTHPVHSGGFYFFLEMFYWRTRLSEPCHSGSRVKFIGGADVALVSFEVQTPHFSNNPIISSTCQPDRSCPPSVCRPFDTTA